jgi:3D (Asp-Asp-Asp) domain-containing protein
MSIFETKDIYHRVTKLILGFVVATSILASTLVPQVTMAKSNWLALAFGLGDSVSAEQSENSLSFPVAEERDPRQTMWITMTAYSSDVAQTDSTPCIPAMPKFDLCDYYQENGVADTIATNFLPLGTKVRFPDLYGDRVFVVRDRMNARYGYGRGDFWMPTYNEAKNFGVKRIKMEIF